MKQNRTFSALVALLLCSSGFAQSTISPANAQAYGANVGWLNLYANGANGVRVGEFFLSGKAWGANLGWIDFGNGAPANGTAYANVSGSDFGVNHDGLGHFSGYAYGANIGWINFSWTADLLDPNPPGFNLGTGRFFGFAYSANLGWVNLGTGYLKTDSLARTDTDGDSIDDAWEMQWFGSTITAGIGTDSDGDGQSDAAEAIADTDPTNPNDFLRIVSHLYSGGLTTVTIQFTTSPARLYRLEHKADLATGSWTDSGLGTFSPDAGVTTTKAFTFTTGARHFFRAVAVRPLTP